MSTPTKENIATVISGLEEFSDRMIKTQSFNLQEFVNFMEPRFASAGYRDEAKLEDKSNILIIHDAGAGDFISQSATIREIRRLYPDAFITLIVFAPAANLAETCPYVDELLVNSRPYLPTFFNDFKYNIFIASQLLERRFDICFAFAHWTGTPFLMYMSGARTRITHSFANETEDWAYGFPDVPLRHSINLATHSFPPFNYGRHMVDVNLSLVDNILNVPISNRAIEIWYTPLDIAIAKSYLKGIIKPIYSLNMGGSNPRKLYPPEQYARLFEMILREECNATFIILGGGQNDLKSVEVIKQVIPKIYEQNIIDLTGKITYRQSAAVLSLCQMHIGNDTGTIHVAAAMKCPVLTPNCFSFDLPTSSMDIPRLFSPYGVPSVIVQPNHALLECKNSNSHDIFGCSSHVPHCITQIEPKTLLKGFRLLKKRVAAKICEPLYIH